MLLLVTDSPRARTSLLERLRTRGIYVLPTPYETAEFCCDKKDTGGVLLDCVAHLGQAERLCATLRARYPEMPIAAILAPQAIPDLAVNRLIRETDDIFDDVLDFCTRGCGWSTSRLTTYDLTVEDDPAKTVYMGYPLTLSPREHTLLRCLFYRAPRVTSVDDLLALCFSDTHLSAANVVTHVSSINRRALTLDPRPLIVNVYGQGYRLRDGIV